MAIERAGNDGLSGICFFDGSRDAFPSFFWAIGVANFQEGLLIPGEGSRSAVHQSSIFSGFGVALSSALSKGVGQFLCVDHLPPGVDIV